jgi:hypothetical protein
MAFQLFSRALDGINRIEQYAQALQIAESRLESAGIAEALTAGSASGRFDERFAWEMTTDRYDGERPARTARSIALYQVRVTVSWRYGLGNQSVSLTSIRPALPQGVQG